MIRSATKADLPQLVELGRVMHAEARRLKKFVYVPGRVYVTLSTLIDSEDGFLQVVESEGEIIGGLAAYIEPHWFSTDRMACDLALFIRPDKRGGTATARLVKAYKAWGKEKGALITQFGIGTGVHLASTSALLEHLDFKPSGFLFDAE